MYFQFDTARTMTSITTDQCKVCENCAYAFNTDSCLLTAIESEHHECLEALLKTGADVNVGCSISLLHAGLKEDVRYIHKLYGEIPAPTGADVNKERDNRYTALMHAARHRQSEFANVLIQAGADVNIQGFDRETALMGVSCSNAL